MNELREKEIYTYFAFLMQWKARTNIVAKEDRKFIMRRYRKFPNYWRKRISL